MAERPKWQSIDQSVAHISFTDSTEFHDVKLALPVPDFGKPHELQVNEHRLTTALRCGGIRNLNVRIGEKPSQFQHEEEGEGKAFYVVSKGVPTTGGTVDRYMDGPFAWTDMDVVISPIENEDPRQWSHTLNQLLAASIRDGAFGTLLKTDKPLNYMHAGLGAYLLASHMTTYYPDAKLMVGGALLKGAAYGAYSTFITRNLQKFREYEETDPYPPHHSAFFFPQFDRYAVLNARLKVLDLVRLRSQSVKG